MLFLEKISHLFCWILGKTLFRFSFRFKIEGGENLKGLKGPLIVIFNHSHWLDAFFVNASLPPTSKIVPVHFATWYKHFWKFFPFLAMAGAFPVKKKIGLEKSLKQGLKILKRKGVVGIAPEERRRHLGRPRKPRRGTVFLALKTNSPILPIYIEGALGLKTSDFFSRKKKVKIKIGKPFYLPSGLVEPDLIKLSNLVMKKVYQLKNLD